MAFTTLLAALALVQSPQAVVTDDKVGEGPEAKFGDIVTINYVGRALDGQIFDSTRLTAPFAFVLGKRQLVQGHARLPLIAFDKALVGMKAGGRRTVTLPPEQAFGDLQVGEIPGGSKLTFNVEMFDVRKPDTEPTLKMETIKEGVGEAVQAGDTVSVNYTGTFLNGRVFDTSLNRPQPDGSTKDMPYPVVVGAGRAIKGFEQALIGMRAGGKRKVTIPYDLGYGVNGRLPAIPGYAVLVFELEVKSLSRPPAN